MIRAVLDTNTTVSAVLGTDSPPALILRAGIDRQLALITSIALLGELERVLAYPRIRHRTGWSDRHIRRFISRMLLVVEVVHPRVVPTVVAADPLDDEVLACALAGRARFIVSGDRHLLALGPWRGIRIVSPRLFLDEIQ